MIFEENGNYTVDCLHDPDRTCCLDCQEQAARTFIYQDIPRIKWPVWLQDKFTELTKEGVIAELKIYRASPKRTNVLLERIVNKLNNSNWL